MFSVLKDLGAFPENALPRAMSDFERALQNSVKKNLPWAAVSTFFCILLITALFTLSRMVHCNPVLRIREPRSGIGWLFDPWIRDPGWEKDSIRIRYPGQRIRMIFCTAYLFFGYFGRGNIFVLRFRDPG
jgi:hypothetical protein